ncbi:uncharacterized protein LOC117526620 [Thalassophryne amazonica]|uniref:uncharacterized protein LOC117526620 n=1 Tax=Thalassophryne amazonica TaxID=390379 RepID=UPI0014725F98|nr:uncharacterized protein LOC117526620 [Thalassophryne amazonica]
MLSPVKEELFASINITTQGQDLPKEPLRPSVDVVQAVALPSLVEGQRAVQEASEQVVGHVAEEILKELLERMVEAVLGQVEGREVKQDEVTVEKGIEEDAVEAEKGNFKIEVIKKAEVLQQVSDNKVLSQMMGGNEGGNAAKEEQEEAEGVNGEVIGDGFMHRETLGESAEETTNVGTQGQVTDGLAKHGHNVAENSAVVEDTRIDSVVVKPGAEGNRDQDPLAKHGTAEIGTWDAAEHPDVVGAAGIGEPVQETMVDPLQDMDMTNVEQMGNPWEKGEALGQDAPTDQMEGNAKVLSSFGYTMEATQTVAQVLVEVNEAEGPEGGTDQSHSVAGGRSVKETGDKDVAGSQINGISVTKKESVVLLNDGLGQGSKAGEDQMALETPHNGDQDLIFAPEPGDQNPERRVPTSNSLQKSNHANEIITSTHNFAHVPVVPQPTLDNLVRDVVVIPPKAEGKKRGQANKMVEPTAATTGTAGVKLLAWKIGAISATVFLILETIILIYILKCHNQTKRNPALPCEEGCADPEATTGGDCRDGMLPPGSRDAQLQAAADPSPVGQNKEKDKRKCETPIADILHSSNEKSSNVGTKQGSSPHLRTSIL